MSLSDVLLVGLKAQGLPDHLASAWLEVELGRMDDPRFAQQFSESCWVAGVQADAYLNRWLPGSPGVLAGIRFKGMDLGRPFVDLLAWDAPLDWPAVIDRLVVAFADFGPKWIRVRLPGEARPAVARAAVDQWVVAAPVAELRARPPLKPVELDVRATDPALWFDEFRAAFQQFQDDSPDIAPQVSPADLADLEGCETVLSVYHQDRWAGVVAAGRGDERAAGGFCMVESFLDRPLRGRRLAGALQRRLVEALPDRGNDSLWGTIHRLNTPSLRTAQSVGRRVVETWWFVDL
jgi:hypothetical protein